MKHTIATAMPSHGLMGLGRWSAMPVIMPPNPTSDTSGAAASPRTPTITPDRDEATGREPGGGEPLGATMEGGLVHGDSIRRWGGLPTHLHRRARNRLEYDPARRTRYPYRLGVQREGTRPVTLDTDTMIDSLVDGREAIATVRALRARRRR
jgi:hypothetical protein